MDEYRIRQIVYIFAAVAMAGLICLAVSNCRTNRIDRRTVNTNPATQPAGSHVDVDPGDNAPWVVFSGTSDASAAIALDERTLLVADDENNVLRAYRIDGGSPTFKFDLTKFMGLEGKHPEADIEAAARIGDRVYWITSHGRNRNGKWRPNRCRFFAAHISEDSGRVAIRPVGRSYSKLAERMMGDPGVREVCPGLPLSYRHGELNGSARQRLAPKDRGLNIEGLCASADGDRLYIGLRNPQSSSRASDSDRAIVLPLLNPAEIVDRGRAPKFGRPMLWDLGGLGVRDMVYSARDRAAFILAGPKDDTGGFALYRWSGNVDEQPVSLQKLDSHKPSWRPEAVVVFPQSSGLFILSDDGVVPIPVSGPADCIRPEYYRYDGTSLNKHLRDETRKYFRALRISPVSRNPGTSPGVETNHSADYP
jgi:hypothetical protein